jgi:hypothetical protein
MSMLSHNSELLFRDICATKDGPKLNEQIRSKQDQQAVNEAFGQLSEEAARAKTHFLAKINSIK